MKAFRIIQVVGFVLVGAYLAALHFGTSNSNLLISLPLPVYPLRFAQVDPAAALGVAILLGFIAGTVPGQIGLWRRRREIGQLKARIRDLEQHLPNYAKSTGSREAYIPDREPEFTADAEESY